MSALPWEVNALTVVAVLRGENDVLYIGADSQWTDSEGLKNFKTKLTVLKEQDNVVVWATAGNPQIGVIEFGRWAKEYQLTGDITWQTFIEAVRREIARLAKIQKEVGQAAGVDVSTLEFIKNNLCEMLICGRLNGEVGAYYVGFEGMLQSIDVTGQYFGIGTGTLFAEAVFRTQEYHWAKLSQTDEQLFQTLMTLTSRHAPNCNLPYEYVEITAEKVSHYGSKEPEPGVEVITPSSYRDR